jgi:hypothetical protein
MKIIKKIVVLLGLNVICCSSFSQQVIFDTTFSYKSDFYSKYAASGVIMVKKKSYQKEGLEITDINLTTDITVGPGLDGIGRISNFRSDPNKIIIPMMNRFLILDTKTFKNKEIGYNNNKVMQFGTYPDIKPVSNDGRYILGKKVIGGLLWEFDEQKGEIISEKNIPDGVSGFYPGLQFSPTNNNILYYTKNKNLFVYDIQKGKEVSKYKLNCGVNTNDTKPSNQATQSDMANIENKLRNLEGINTQDINKFNQDFIVEGLFNALSTIPTWPDIREFAAQPYGNKLVVSYEDIENIGINELFVWKVSKDDPANISSEKPWTILTGHTSVPWRIIFSNNGKYLATKGNKEGILWDANTGIKIGRFTDYPIDFAPDEQLLMTSKIPDEDTGDNNKKLTICFISTSNGNVVKSTIIPYDGTYYKAKGITFNSDGTGYSVFLSVVKKNWVKWGTKEIHSGPRVLIIKDNFLSANAIKGKLLGSYNLLISDFLCNAISQYSSEISKEFSLLKVVEPKGEYESTAEYNLRVENVKNEPLKIISKYWTKQLNCDRNNNFSASLDSVGKYNADKKEFPVYFLGTEAKIPIVSEEARDFKENWSKIAKIEGQIGYFNKTSIPLIQNTTIKRPFDNKVYPVMIKKQAFAEYMKVSVN